ncbi:O-antigen ligase family protein [Neobacillus thermocopriae]|uniref:O-antigen ligase family protein n=1 Tax=Neobacillus thermocopriae TaxID=1215031 RepID=UPI00376FFA33
MEMILTSEEKRIPRVLFTVILIMLVPFIISFQIFDNRGLLLPLVAGSYLILILLMLIAFYKGIGKHQYFTIIYFLIQLMPLFINSFKGIEINYQDYINIIAKSLNYFIFFGLILSIKIKKMQFKYFLRYFIYFSIIACIYNLISNFGDITNIGNITSGYEVTLKSFFVNKNQFGAFLFVSIIAFYYFLSGKKIKMLDVLILLLFIINLILTMSRGAILATIIFFIFFYLQHLKHIKLIAPIIIFLSITSLVILSSDRIITFIKNNIIRVDAGVTGRTEIWDMGMNIYVQNNFLNGVGYFTGLDLAKGQGFQFEEFHSLYIDTLVSGGIIELFFIFILLGYIFIHCITKCPEIGYKKIYLASFFGILALGIFESISFFTLGYVGTLFTVFYISIPLLLSKIDK